MKFLSDNAPSCIKETKIDSYFGRKIAVDASLFMYQFIISARSGNDALLNESGETTSHLSGVFYKSIRLLEHGIKPVYVFDGKAPVLKANELKKRSEKREIAKLELAKALEEGDEEKAKNISKRTVKVDKSTAKSCKKLLSLMGIPYIKAPSDAEAQCCALVKAGMVYGVATEDMDVLTFGGETLIKHMTLSGEKSKSLKEVKLSKILSELELTQDEFIDLCILFGCDYCETIKGIGPVSAFKLIKKHRSIEKIMEQIDKKKYGIPEDFTYSEAREIFKNPSIKDPDSFKLSWKACDKDGIINFLVKEHGFNEDRIISGIKRFENSRSVCCQTRIDSFFAVKRIEPVNGDDKKISKIKKETKPKGRTIKKT